MTYRSLEENLGTTLQPASLSEEFYTPEQFAAEQAQRMESPRGRLLIASCRSGDALASLVANKYRERLEERGADDHILTLHQIDGRFSDTETYVRLEQDVSGHDVYLFQALYNPTLPGSIDQNYIALLIAARAFREWGANHVTAILPYLAYARQDKPTLYKREPASANLLADLSIEAGIDRLVTWHPHSPHLQGFYDQIPLDRLESHNLFFSHFQRFSGREDAIVVAPDLGASKYTVHLAHRLQLSAAMASKLRPRPEEALINEVIGDFTGKRLALIVDDMISTGGTVYALIKALVEQKGIQEIYLGASHNLCLEIAHQRLLDLHERYHLRQVVVTNSIPQTEAFLSLPFFSVLDLSHIFSLVINRIHYNRPVSELFYR